MPGKLGRYDGKTERQRLAEAEAILSDKVNGYTVSRLMEKYDLSEKTVHRRVNEALERRLPATVESYREQQNALLDELMDDAVKHRDAADALIQLGVTANDVAVITAGMAQRAKAHDMRLRVSERRAKLNGSDAPIKTDLSVTVTTPLDTAIEGLVSQLDALDQEPADAPAPG